MRIEITGRARLVGDDVNTDYILSSVRKKETLDPAVLKQYLLESLDPAFASSLLPGDLLVAGKNFGCGSAMEVAVTVVLAAGTRAVLARSFSRTYYRNAINNGLIPVECDTRGINEGDDLRILIDEAGVRVLDRNKERTISAVVLPRIMLDILDHGGLILYFRKFHDFATG